MTFWYWMLNLWCGHVVIYLADWFSQLYGTRINAKSWLNFCGKNQTYYRYNCIQHSKVNRVRHINNILYFEYEFDINLWYLYNIYHKWLFDDWLDMKEGFWDNVQQHEPLKQDGYFKSIFHSRCGFTRNCKTMI